MHPDRSKLTVMLSRTRRARFIATGGLGMLTLVFVALRTAILTSLAIIRPPHTASNLDATAALAHGTGKAAIEAATRRESSDARESITHRINHLHNYLFVHNGSAR
jgi:hypothetical protein